MKKLLKLVLFLLLLGVIISLFFANCEGKGDVKTDGSSFTFLVAGYDNAAENTDVLFLMSYEKNTNEISVIQIPRDSFVEYRGSYGKINRIYSSERASGKSGGDALTALQHAVEDYLGININASVALSLDAFMRFIDNFDGVTVNVPENVRLDNMPVKLSYGVNTISAKDALKLVRERKNYPNGDLGRLDVQKIVLDGIFHTAFEKIDTKMIAKLIFTRDDEVFFDANLFEISGFLIREYGDIKNAGITLLTLPGEALEYEGVSYYVVNKAAAKNAVLRYIGGGNFDKEFKLTDRNNALINSLYEKKVLSYKVYSYGKLIDINVS